MKYTDRTHALACMFCSVLALTCCVTAQAEEILLFDNFDGPSLDSTIWGLATWNIGDRTQFGNQPEFGSENNDEFIKFISLPLDTWNPNVPGARVFGTEIYSLQNFDNSGGIEYLARARLATTMPGMVAAFFTYNQKRQKRRWISDEIDFEVLSKQPFDRVLLTSWNDWGAAGSDYDDGVHHLGAFLDLPDYNWQDWNNYAIRWYPDRVEWYVNEALVETHTTAVPDLPQPARASLWAAGTTWPDAYDPSLEATADEHQNQRFTWDIDWIMVIRLGGGGSSDPPAAPANLSANVTGHDVNLSWTDVASNESGFTVYRAWKPKGKASPDFVSIASLGANVTEHQDTVPDGQFLFRVTAFSTAGESLPSNSVTVSVGSGGNGGKP